MDFLFYIFCAFVLLAILILMAATIKVVPQYERGVVLTLGKFSRVCEPGLNLLIPFIETMQRAEIREQVMSISPQDVITKDNVSVRVDAVAFFRIIDPKQALLAVEEYASAISRFAEITLRSNIGENTLDELLTEQQKLNAQIAQQVETTAKTWGVHITRVQIRSVDLDKNMIRAMAQEAEALRGKRARVITADGEKEAAEALATAARMLGAEPGAMMLRTLATLKEIGAEQNSIILFPVPQESMMAPSTTAAALAQSIAAKSAHATHIGAAPHKVIAVPGGNAPTDTPNA